MSKLQMQQTCFENIKSLCTNYRKDSSSRKTEDYLNIRLASLEAQWQDFEARNALLVLEIEDKTITYFAERVYEKTKEMYLTTKADIDSRISALTEHKRGTNFNLVGVSEDDSQDTDDGNGLQRLLNKQECNFNAIHRAMSKIDISRVSEKWELEENITILKSKWETIDKLHWEIDFQLKGSNAHYYETFTTLEEQYDDLRKKLNSKIWSNAHYEKSAPRIELPDFSGNYGKWISFKDLFLETIHNNPTINLAPKMRHLKTKLKGEAESLVQHLSVSAENYNSCWEILTQRYDNRRLQFTSFFNTMMNLPVIQHPESNNLKKMHDVIKECMNGMSNIGLDTSTWDPMIVQLMLPKLDSSTLNDYMNEIRDHRELQNLSDFLYFLESKFMAYETAKSTKKSTATTEKSSQSFSKWKTSTKRANFDFNKSNFYHAVYGQCPHCSGNHVLMQCEKFLELDTTQRNNIVTKLKLCKNCLYSHNNEECKSKKLCKECNLKHHTLLHHSNKKFLGNKSIHVGQNPSSSRQQANHLFNCNTEILLTTMQLKVKSVDGTYLTLRALLDQGAQGNLITENAAQLLRLPRKKMTATVTGIGAVSEDCRGQLTLSCKSIHSDFTFETQALIMKKLTNNLPHSTFEKCSWPHLENLKLADPDFNVSRPVDLLLGADVYAEIIMDGVLKGSQQSPVAQQTQLGWILCGKMRTLNCHVALINMEELTKFWETEEIITNKTPSDECEQFYRETVQRGSDGKYIVKMPLCPNYEEKLGQSRPIAVSQFLQLEKRFKKNPNLATMYKDFINEYAELGHMKQSSTSTSPTCYLPHHGVLRENSTTTKLRVVFNASQKNSNGLSLNSLLEKGPNLQKDIQTLILKWRTYRFALIADIQMMYRCIWISEEQQHLLRVIWRESSNEPLKDFQLCTLTYGTKCAPWLAMRMLIQLANDDGNKFPAAAKEALKNSFYMDDLICGENTIFEAKELQQSLIALLKGGGMNLRKWSSNHASLLEGLPSDQIAPNNNYEFKTEEPSKTLGLSWNPTRDSFHFNWPINETSKRITKRSLLSQISKFYDPLGWLSPVTVTAKLLFQKLWTVKIDWDDDVPKDIELEWVKLKTELPLIKSITLDRWIGENKQPIELMGFCDASEKAYACVVYCRTIDEKGTPKLTLVAARTRVAPLAQKITLPKLELCGALLLAELMEKIKEAFSDYNTTITAWCDSQVALAWIQGETSKWEVYVANRVNKIKRIIPASYWRYIKSEQNPADCASRGTLPSKLINFKLWWQGPDFLKDKETELNIKELCRFQTNHGCITYAKKSNLSSNDEHLITLLLNKCSSLLRVTRIITWILRFINNTRNEKKFETPYLTASELKTANELLIKYVQRTQFTEEYKQLTYNEPISKRSSILKLNPYIGEDNLIRVGGRLKNSSLPLEMKNPIIVPYSGRFTQLLIDQAHLSTLHGGARLTLTHIRQRYWIVAGNRAVKTQLRRCVRCHRFSQADHYQLMGELQTPRVTPCRPFTHTGVDFSGNVEIKLNKGRGVKTSKGYIAIFICMTTKAVHLELVSDLSTETFIAAFQRLCARRGTPKHMYSDCGTNFIGASRILKQEFQEFKELLSTDFFNELAKLEVTWHYNCPKWPSAAGLWESGVKSMKHHLRRVLGDQKLTYEEFSTLLTKIEACLNSRPLCPLTENPEEFYNCLTPGHFITGSSILSLPLSNYSDANIDIRRRWQLVERMSQQYWKTWSTDYLTQLQARSKWNKPTKNIKIGDIVLVKEDNLPPGKWALGRVLETHPGSDGYVRVTTIKTQSGVLKRPVVKLSPLPLDSEAKTIDPVTETQKETIRNCKQNTRRRKGNKTLSNLLITMLTMFTFLSESYGSTAGGVSSGAQITSLEHERPIYYDTIGKVQMVHNEWTLIMYYNLSTYWEGNRHLDDYFTNLKNLCVKSNLQQCLTTMEQLSHEMDLLHHYNDILINPHKHLTVNRKKRGLIDGVGYVANSLFGVLDQRFAEKYESDIQSMRNNDNYLLELIKNQTTIMELENKILKKSEENIQRQFNMISGFVNQTNQNMAALDSEIEILSASTYFNSASLTLYLLINSLRKFQETLFDSLTNVYQGHVDIQLITPVHLIQQLSEISGSIPKSLSLPIENYKEDIKELYNLIFVKARVTENYFLFEIHIPLISNEDFTLYKTIPLPMKIDKNFAHVRVISRYIGVNFEKNIYVLLTEDNFEQCLQKKSEKFICKKNPPVYDLHSNNTPCEAKLLSHQNTAPCDLERMQCKDSWIELHSPNSWLIVCCESCTVRMICSSDVTSYSMTSSSIITLPQGCVAQSKDLTIYSNSHYSSRIKMDYELTAPTFNMNTSVNKIVNLTSYLALPRELQFNKIDEDIAYQEKQEVRLPTISSHDIHQYVISYTLLAAAVVFLLVLVGRKYCSYRYARNVKTTSPSQRTEDIEMQVFQRPDEYRERADHHGKRTPGTSRRSATGGTPNLAFNFD